MPRSRKGPVARRPQVTGHLQVPAQRCSFWARPEHEDSSRQSEKGLAPRPLHLGVCPGALAREPRQQQGEQGPEDRGKAGSAQPPPRPRSPGSPQAALRASQLPRHRLSSQAHVQQWVPSILSTLPPHPTPFRALWSPWPLFCKGGKRKQMRSWLRAFQVKNVYKEEKRGENQG